MPGRGTPVRPVRVPDALWDRFGELARAAGTDRATVIRDLIRWYVGEAGAKPPKRPG